MIVILSEESARKASPNSNENQIITEAARMFGCRVFTFPSNFDECETAENALTYLPHFETPILGIWVGYIPDFERYQAICNAAQKKNVVLINSPEQHRIAMEFDHFYPLLQGLTPKSIVISEQSQVAGIPDELNFPVFVKGAVKSNKEQGWKAVVAHDVHELMQLAEQVFSQTQRSRGKVIVRQLVDLKTVAVDANGFPIGKEYRAFLYRGEILAYGFYWDEYADPEPLSGEDKQQFIHTVKAAANRVNVPFLSVDAGQLKTGEWTIIEIADGQFSGLSQIPVLELWGKIKDLTL